MVTTFDLLYVVCFAVAMPLYDYMFGQKGYERRVQASAALARAWLWKSGITYLWVIIGVGAAYWVYAGRPWSGLKLTLPEGWRLVVAAAIAVAYSAWYLNGIAQLRRDAALRESVRATMGGATAVVPHKRSELPFFMGVSVTAGFCEEFLFRGYFIWTLAPWLGWWGAAALSTVIFGIGHAYQGLRGVINTGIMGAVYVLLVALLDSLWPAIVLHVLVDMLNGIAAWIVLRDGPHSRISSGHEGD